MHLAIVFNENRLVGKLTKFYTDSYAYHTGWADLERNLWYDMDLLRRRRPWPRYSAATNVVLYNFPEVTAEYLEQQLTTDESVYGFRDYLLFAVKPLYHLVGKNTRNLNGQICSEMCNIDLRNCGVITPWALDQSPPSPADLDRWCATLNRRV